MHERPHPHLNQVRRIWKELEQYRRAGKLTVDGHSLDIAGVVAVSRFVPRSCLDTGPQAYHYNYRHECKPDISQNPEVVNAVNDSVETLNRYLADGSFLYGKPQN